MSVSGAPLPIRCRMRPARWERRAASTPWTSGCYKCSHPFTIIPFHLVFVNGIGCSYICRNGQNGNLCGSPTLNFTIGDVKTSLVCFLTTQTTYLNSVAQLVKMAELEGKTWVFILTWRGVYQVASLWGCMGPDQGRRENEASARSLNSLSDLLQSTVNNLRTTLPSALIPRRGRCCSR